MPSIEDLQQAKSSVKTQLLRYASPHAISRTNSISQSYSVSSSNVHAVGIGCKIVDGKRTKEKCIRIYVHQKMAVSLLPPREVIPRKIDGIPTDIIASEMPKAFAKKKSTKKKSAKKRTKRSRKTTTTATNSNCSQNRRNRQRPVIAGISCAHRDVTAGTLGCYCVGTGSSDDPNQLLALSNNHVIANSNNASVGDPLYQPGPADGGSFSDHFAELYRFVRINMLPVSGPWPINKVDAALGRPLSTVQIQNQICQIGQISGSMTGVDNMLVRKHGRTSGYTEGYIDDPSYDGLTRYGAELAYFENQLRIMTGTFTPFALGGDSGSAIVHRTSQNVVGLLYAGGNDIQTGLPFTTANQIEDVLSELDIQI